MGIGGLLGVNTGSSEPPVMIKLTYTPSGTPSSRSALVGKGIMYDSAGLAIKPGDAVHAHPHRRGGAYRTPDLADPGADVGHRRRRGLVPDTRGNPGEHDGHGPAGYRFADYWKLGLVFMLLFFVVSVFLVPVFWAF